MGQPWHRQRAGTAAALLASSCACLGATTAGAQALDISQTPLASASNLSVLPNLLFLLDDSGSMMFDALPDHTERVQGGAERRYWHRNFNCKSKNVPTTANTAALRDLLPNHCERTDPPFGAVEYNGMYYNPQFTYRPPVNAEGTSYPSQTSWSAVSCDPFSSKWKCRDWYRVGQAYYDSGSIAAEEVSGQRQTYSNSHIKQWYGSGDIFNVQNDWPEVVYCLDENKNNLNDLDQCRRNGFENTGAETRHTGNPFRYTSARWGASGGAYPDAEPVHEFWREAGSSTIRVTTAFPLNVPVGTPTFQFIPRTFTGVGPSGLDYRANAGSCGPNTTHQICTATVTGPNTFTYSNGQTGERLVNSPGKDGVPADSPVNFDLIVNLARVGNVVTVRGAWNHGLKVGDRIDVVEVSCSIAPCNFTLTNTAVTVIAVTRVVDPHRFEYAQTGNDRTGTGYYRRSPLGLYAYPKLRRGSPHYYTIEAVDYCADSALTNCQSVQSAGFTMAAPVRYCSSQFDAHRLDTPTGSEANSQRPRCRKKYEEASGYIHPRYGQFRRVDITSSASFPGRSLRTDCKNRPICSFAEEMTNFANWFAYYRTRMLMMKTATGVAFSPIDSRYRVGFLTINPDNPVKKERYLKIDDFTPTHKQAWYEALYRQEPRGGTPLPQALARAGRHFAGVKDGINRGMDDDPLQFSCQQNFALLTTDGYWSGRSGVDENGNAIGNVDNDAAKAPRPQFDGGSPFNPNPSDPEFNSSGTLADVALHFYQTDLRKSGATGVEGADVSENNVPTSDKDRASWQHMVTFGLGMAEGLMDWRADYESPDATGDFDNVRRGALGKCSWTPGACNWPMPGSRTPSNLDDLWHAAVNGRGSFFYARDTQAVQDSLNTALTNLNARNASGSAAATSTPNVTPSDRAIFLTSFTTIEWTGDVQARLINPNDGSVLPDVAWSARDRLQGLVAEASDKRTIYLADYDQPDGLKPFRFSNLSEREKSWFANKCNPVSNMTQCALLDPTTARATANDGANMVNYLRGHTQHEASLYRDRKFALGDIANSIALYVGRPRFGFGDRVALTYFAWRELAQIKNRTPALYVGANDGQLHAFNANTGEELWSFIPRQVAPGLWRLAEKSYATKHQYFVDGSPTFMDVWDGSIGSWRTILVGGLNAGGRGFYALDITNPNAPVALWEFCSDRALCPVSDVDLGLSFGNPVITKRASDGRWVALVTSGYNNVTPGDGRGYLYALDAIKGTLLEKIGTGSGSATQPSGLGRIAAWADNFLTDNTARWVYAGNQHGEIWKFDLTARPAKVIKLAEARAANGAPQPITTRPELGLVDGKHRVLFVGTGRYLGASDLTDPATQSPPGAWAWQQSVYAFKDLDTPMGNLRDPSNLLVQQTIVELSGAQERTASNNRVDWATQGGWYFDLDPGGRSPGERVNIDPQLALGTLLVTTNVPGASACSVGGDSWVYQLDYRTGFYVLGAPNNLVARRQTGALTAGLVVYQLQKGSVIGQVQRSETTTRKEDIVVAPASTKSRRTSWREITPGIE